MLPYDVVTAQTLYSLKNRLESFGAPKKCIVSKAEVSDNENL